METSKAKRRLLSNKYAKASDAKSFAKHFLPLNEDQFELENIKSQRIKETIDYIIYKEAAKENSQKGMAFIIKLYNNKNLPEIHSDINKMKLESKNLELKKRAKSPDLKDTYT